jgi:hypothetical protein
MAKCKLHVMEEDSNASLQALLLTFDEEYGAAIAFDQ